VYFNNAGIPEQVKPLAEITRAEWDQVLDVNLTALFVAAQVVAPKLRHGGLLLVTASIIANRPRAGLAAYVASKAGVIGLAKALAVELAPDVRVNVINPGPANTPMLGGFGFDSDVAQALPLKRLIEPEDIAGAAAYLASDEARAITGAVFNVDGGRDL
jgi:3-oxoacyl-[acyl-carrier protein] reductase